MAPDGGWGWLVVFASFMIHAVADGVAYTFGLFYPELVTYFGSSKGLAAWVPSIMTGMTFIIGPIAAGLTNRYGCRNITILGSILAAFGFASSVLVPSIYFLLVTIGLIAGAGFGLIYFPAILCVTIYFEKRRAFATGIAVCGSGIGSAIFAPLTHLLIEKLSWRGAMLTISFIILCCALFGCLFRPLPSDEEDEYEEEEDDNDTCESNQLNDSLNDLPNKGHLPRFSLDNANVHGTAVNITSGKLEAGCQTKTRGDADNSYLKPKTICYSASVLSLPHYKSSPALFGVDSFVRSNSTVACRTGSHSVKILNCNKSNDAYNNNDLDDSKSDSNDMVIEKCPRSSPRNSYLAATLKIFTDFEILKNEIFLLFTISNFATSLGFYVPHIYLKDKAVTGNNTIESDPSSNISDSDVAQLFGLIGLGSTVGRLFFGYLSDQRFVNRLWLYIACVVVSGAGVVICAFTNSYHVLAGCSITYGLAGGGYVSLTSVLLVDLLGLEKLSSAFGILLLFQGVASLTGPPVIGILYDETGSYDIGFTLAGVLIIISGLILIPVCLMRKEISKSAAGMDEPPEESKSSPPVIVVDVAMDVNDMAQKDRGIEIEFN